MKEGIDYFLEIKAYKCPKRLNPKRASPQRTG